MSARCRRPCPSIRAELGASLRQAGWLLSIVNLITALGGMAIALTADRFGHRRLVLLGTALCLAASLLGALAGSVDVLLVGRVFEGLGFIAVVVAIPTAAAAHRRAADQRLAMALWTTYMPAGAGSMMLIAALVLPGTSWRVAWLVAAGASAADAGGAAAARRCRATSSIPCRAAPSGAAEMAEVATSGGPLAIAVCFGAYSCCWFAVIGFLPTLQVERLGFSTSTAAIVTARRHHRECRRQSRRRLAAAAGRAAGRRSSSARPCSMAVCAAGHLPRRRARSARLVLAGVYSAVIGVVPGCLFTAIPGPCAAPAAGRRGNRPADAGARTSAPCSGRRSPPRWCRPAAGRPPHG